MLIWIWWSTMLCNSTINIWLWNKKRNKKRNKKLDYLAGLYIGVNAYRSTFPVIHSTNTCLIAYSSPFVERSLSTIAELAFIIQLTQWFQLENDYIIKLICAAEISCWLGIITGNQYWHVFEESIWCYCAIFLLIQLRYNRTKLIKFKKILTTNILYGYISYMIIYDIPLYITNPNVEKKQILLCENISTDFTVWKPYLIWMTGYFTMGSWVSLALR